MRRLSASSGTASTGIVAGRDYNRHQHFLSSARLSREESSMMRAAAISIILAAGLSAQSTPTFEVASVKIHPDPPHVINISTSGVRLEAEAEMVRGLISWAYDLK